MPVIQRFSKIPIDCDSAMVNREYSTAVNKQICERVEREKFIWI